MLDLLFLVIVSIIISLVSYKIGRKKKKIELKPVAILLSSVSTAVVLVYFSVQRFDLSMFQGKRRPVEGFLDFD